MDVRTNPDSWLLSYIQSTQLDYSTTKLISKFDYRLA